MIQNLEHTVLINYYGVIKKACSKKNLWILSRKYVFKIYKKGLEKHRNNASMFFMCHNLKKMAIWRWKYKKKRLIFIFFKNNNF